MDRGIRDWGDGSARLVQVLCFSFPIDGAIYRRRIEVGGYERFMGVLQGLRRMRELLWELLVISLLLFLLLSLLRRRRIKTRGDRVRRSLVDLGLGDADIHPTLQPGRLAGRRAGTRINIGLGIKGEGGVDGEGIVHVDVVVHVSGGEGEVVVGRAHGGIP